MKKFLLSLAAVAASFSLSAQDGAPLYATGNFEASNWAPEAPVEFEWDGANYNLLIENVGMFKVSTEMGDWDTFNASALCVDGEVNEPGTFDLTSGDGNIVVPWTGDWTVVVSGDLATVTLSTTTPKPTGFKEVYLRGGMNGWGVDEAWKFVTTDDVVFVLADVVIEEGVEFKVADAGWAQINYGADTPLLIDEELPLVFDSATNITVDYEGESYETVTLVFNLNDKTLLMTQDYSGIEGINADNVAADNVYYDLTGRRVMNPTRGLYIVNGAKVLIK